jgi:hypothetical protein
MGGELVLTARFPDRDPVRITGLGISPALESCASRALQPYKPVLITFDMREAIAVT